MKPPSPRPDEIAAAQHLALAAHHLAAVGRKASYWRFLAASERVLGRHDLEALFQRQANRYLPIPTDHELNALCQELWPGSQLLARDLRLVRAVLERLPHE